MKKLLLSVVAVLLVMFTLAQQVDKATALRMITENAAKIRITNEEAVASVVTAAYKDEMSGATLVYVQQGFRGIPVFNQLLVLAFKDGKVVSNAGHFLHDIEKIANPTSGVAALSAADAVRVAYNVARVPQPAFLPVQSVSDNGKKYNYGNLPGVSNEVLAELIWSPLQDENIKSLKLAWSVQIAPQKDADHWIMHIDAATGALIRKVNLTVHEGHSHQKGHELLEHNEEHHKQDVKFTGLSVNNLSFTPPPPPTVTTATYKVVPYPVESPWHGAIANLTDPWNNAGVGNNAITNGWHFDGTNNYNITRGNNVFAYLDAASSNTSNATTNWPDTSSTAIPALNFVTQPNFSLNSKDRVNKKFAITNLFYWNNITHDIAYQYGFDEVSGNFQTDNLGRGGVGNDWVRAEAQDGGGLNNANFSTPADGSLPRMQMYLWDTVALTVNTPAPIAGDYYAVESGFSTSNKLANVGPVTGQVVYYNDDAGGTTHDGCVVPANSVSGKIALINRGNCNFTVKVKNAQDAGAIGVIMVNNVAGAPIIMGGTDNTITIPAVMVTQALGATFVANLANNLNVTLKVNYMDGDLDNGIVVHEYTHGISNRLTGGPATSSCLGNAEQGGEGWSDYYALMLTTNWATAQVGDGVQARPVGTYAFHQPNSGSGIRNYPYSTNLSINPLTYANMGVAPIGTEVHNTGEIWCVALWEMTWGLIQQSGITPNLYNAAGTGGNVIALKLVTQGMKLQPCSPGFLDARNAILRADTLLYGGVHSCTIWEAFAKRGMGWSAIQGSAASATDQTAATDLPPTPTITTHPQSVTKCEGESTTFSVAATGAGLSYAWQLSTNGGSSWSSISGATSATYTVSNITAAMNNYKYAVSITGGCAPTTVSSNVATLTVTTGASFTSQPSNASVCSGSNATFTAATSGSGLTYNWQVSTDGGATWNNVSPAVTTTTLTLTGVTTTMNNYQYRLAAMGGCSATSTVYSNGAILTVTAGSTSITSQPSNATVCQGANATFTVAASGTNTYQWQVSTNGGSTWTDVGGATNASYTITGATATQNNYQYRVVITYTGSCSGTLNSTAAVLTVNSAVAITSQPANASACAAGSATFTATATGGTPTYQWQVSTTGCSGTFSNISGATNASYTVSSVTTGISGYAYQVLVSNGCSSNIASSCATLTVNAALSITQQPAASSVCEGASATFTTASNITSATYQWQVSTDGGATWTNISGATAASYTIAATTVSQNNNQYRAVVTTTGSCAANLNSSAATLSVTAAAAITSQPSAITTCPGTNTSFTVATTGNNIGYQWQVSTTGCGGTFTNISGATSATLSLTGVTTGMSGYAYRVVLGNSCNGSSIASNCATLTVNTNVSLSQQPGDVTICSGANATFSTAASGTGVSYQWQVSTDGGASWANITGATSASYTVSAATTAQNNNKYRAVVTNACNTTGVNTNAATLTVNSSLAISTQPQSVSKCVGTAMFSITATGSGTLSFQWQLSTDAGATWVNIGGAVLASYTTPTVTTAMNNNRYRVVVSSSVCGTSTSNAATLTVGAAPTVNVTSSGVLTPISTVTLTASANPSGTYTYQWYKNGVLVTGATASTHVVNVDNAGAYTVSVVETATGCSATSGVTNVSETEQSGMFVYPNPTSGLIHVRSYATAGSVRILRIYDNKGALVISKQFTLGTPYQSMDASLANHRAGLYLVVLADANGTRLGVKRIMKQ